MWRCLKPLGSSHKNVFCQTMLTLSYGNRGPPSLVVGGRRGRPPGISEEEEEEEAMDWSATPPALLPDSDGETFTDGQPKEAKGSQQLP